MQYNDNFTMIIENNHILPYLIVGITVGKPFYPTGSVFIEELTISYE